MVLGGGGGLDGSRPSLWSFQVAEAGERRGHETVYKVVTVGFRCSVTCVEVVRLVHPELVLGFEFPEGRAPSLWFSNSQRGVSQLLAGYAFKSSLKKVPL